MFRLQLFLLTFLICGGVGLSAQSVPTPRSEFGFDVGTDRKMADWGELTAYFEKVANASPRVHVDTLGASTMGRPFVMLTITSPENHARLEELKEIQLRLADPRKVRNQGDLDRLLDQGNQDCCFRASLYKRCISHCYLCSVDWSL